MNDFKRYLNLLRNTIFLSAPREEGEGLQQEIGWLAEQLGHEHNLERALSADPEQSSDMYEISGP